jgi:hypothetical protein
VLDHDDRVALVDERVQDADQLLAVAQVQADRRLLEDVEVPGRRPGCARVGRQARDSSVTSLSRWASPPESVEELWPSVR